MIYEEKRFLLRDGRVCALRTPEESEAETLLSFIRTACRETDYLIYTPKEAESLTLESEKGWLSSERTEEKVCLISAYVEGEHAGNADISAGGLEKFSSYGVMGIALLEKFWGLGIGRLLFSELERIAVEWGLTSLRLDHFAGNVRAHSFYEKMGFVQCGVYHRGVKRSDGTFDDVILMEKRL